ncbi:hypothetical protein AB9H05_23875 [Escherichia coli]|uniref:hypothetical protein n=2 Tax=Escherichia coli TaxID=562 RepID=UPI003512155B
MRQASNTAAAVSPVLNLSRASPSPAPAICTHPGRWRGGAGAQNIRGHLRSSAPGQQHGGSGQPGAEPEPRQPVTRSRDLHPSRTLARWRGSAEHQGHLRSSAPGQQHGSSGQPGAEPELRQPVTRSRDLHPSRTLARWRGSAEHQGGICAAVRPASNTAAAVSPVPNLSRASPSPAPAICTHPGRWRGGAGAPNIRGHLRSSAPCQQHGSSGQPGAEPEPRQPVTRSRDLHPSRTLARWRGSAEHQGGICAAVRPASNTAAAVSPVLNLSHASPSPALAICAHPGRWRGGAGVPNIRGHLRSSAPGQQHSGSGQPGAEPELRQPVTRSRICTHPGRWRGGAGVQNIREHLRSSAPCQQHSGSGQPGAEPEPRQPVTRFRDLHPSRTLARWRGGAGAPNLLGICAAVRPDSTTAAAVSPALNLSRASPSPAFAICTHPGRWRGGAGAPNLWGICAAVRPDSTTASAVSLLLNQSRASPSPALAICTHPGRWRGGAGAANIRRNLRSSAVGTRRDN